MSGGNSAGGKFHRIARHETAPLIALILIALGIWCFAAIVDEVLENETRAVDRAILHALRSPSDQSDPIGPEWFERMARDIDAMGGFAPLTFISLSAFVYLLLLRKFRSALLLACAVGGGGALSILLKFFIGRPRPELVAGETSAITSSFPSGHTLMAVIVYIILGGVLAGMQPNRVLKSYFLLLALLLSLMIGATRIYMGMHWPTDVLAGWILGAVWALLFWLIVRFLQRKGWIEPDVPVPEE